MDSCLPYGYYCEVKSKQTCPEFEFRSLIPFPMTITLSIMCEINLMSCAEGSKFLYISLYHI